MLSKEKILSLVNGLIAQKEFFIISLDISTSNQIKLVVDSMKGNVSIDDCVELSRAIEHNLDREQEDFELEVSSAGLSEAFKVKEQFLKNMGNEVEAQLKDGRKIKGILLLVKDDSFTLEEEKRVKVEGKKKKQLVKEKHTVPYSESSKVKLVIKF